jgi:hypothetical protein
MLPGYSFMLGLLANLTTNYPLAFAGHTFPGHTALYTVVPNSS